MDLNGSGEFDALTTFLSAHAAATAVEGDVLPVGQLQLEIRAREGRSGRSRTWCTFNLVRGVRPKLAEYLFINIRGNHALVNEAFN
ncbi:hypothetical protein EDB83DRAFT_2329424 [Lactarius deliciosus]|nr:hypothetical protein EDB83DRAFT_2329424 [Lactarius deliciosus]